MAAPPMPLKKTAEEWRQLVSPAAFRVLFEEGTERAGSSPLNAEKRPGTFVCAACNLPLFDAAHKYESGTGWPSFWQPLPDAVGTSTDFKLILPAHRIPLRALRWAPGPCVQRRPATHRQALLQQRRGAGLRAPGRGVARSAHLNAFTQVETGASHELHHASNLVARQLLLGRHAGRPAPPTPPRPPRSLPAAASGAPSRTLRKCRA